MHYLFLADGFEEIEALCPLDLMRRAGLNIQTVGMGKKVITGAHQIPVQADLSDEELFEIIDNTTIESIILPGGMPGTTHLDESPLVHHAIELALQQSSLLCAICAAPSILGKMGLLNQKEATCFPGFEDSLIGATISAKKVVKDGQILTAAGMGAALDFGLAIVASFCGEEKSQQIRKNIQTP